MRKWQRNYIICFIFTFLLLFINVQVFAGTVIRVSKVSINKNNDTLVAGQTDILKAKFTPTNATNRTVKWRSSNNTIAKVDIWGKVTSLKAGITTITGVTADKGLKVACKITVKPKPYVPSLKLLFNLNDTHNFQSLTYFNNYIYCGFDVGSGQGEISKYSMTGTKISQTKPMKIGHSADLGYRTKTGNIYMANRSEERRVGKSVWRV